MVEFLVAGNAPYAKILSESSSFSTMIYRTMALAQIPENYSKIKHTIGNIFPTSFVVDMPPLRIILIVNILSVAVLKTDSYCHHSFMNY